MGPALAFLLLVPAQDAAQAHGLLDRARSSLNAGAYGDALSAGKRAAAIFHALHDAADETLAINAAGSAQLYSGDYAGALRSFEDALAIDRTSGDAKGEITRLSNIGNVYFFQGRYLDALRSYEQAQRRVEETSAEPWNAGRRELVLTNLAALYEQLGQNGKALDYYRQALAGEREMPPTERAQLLSNVGTLYRRLGDAVKALENYQAAQRLYAQAHLSDGEIHVLQNIGIARALDLADLKGAVAEFSRALALTEGGGNRREAALAHLFRGEALYRAGRASEAARDFEAALAAARAMGAREEQWTALFGLGRIERDQGEAARALSEFREAIATIESVRSGLGSSLKTEFLADKRRVYDAAIDLMLRGGGADAQQLFDLFEAARARNLRDALRETHPSMSAVQARLAPDTMLLEYWMAGGRVAALWMTRERSGVVARTLPSGEPDQFAAALEANEPRWRQLSVFWARMLIDGVPLTGHVTQLLIVPDGALAEIPFEALDNAALLRRYAISYLPSAGLLLRPGNTRRLMPWQRRLLAFGDPVVRPDAALPGDEAWAPLPDSIREVQWIGRALPGRVEAHTGGDDRKRYLVDEGANWPPLLHMSTHAAIDLTDPGRSRILFTPEAGLPGSQYLFRGEVEALHMRGVDLVTLSACDTERGKLTPGEGVQGFSRAFLGAGARSTVTTLWRAADGPSAGLMRLFYERLGRGDSKGESLRAAKLRFLDSGKDLAEPRYWAPFILTGDGQAPIPPAVSWLWFALPLPAAGAAIFLFRYYPRARRNRQAVAARAPAEC